MNIEIQDWKGSPGSLSQSSAVPCTSLLHWLFLFSRYKAEDVLSILLELLYIQSEISALQVSSGFCVFDLSALTGVKNSQRIILISQSGGWTQMSARLEGVQGYLYSLRVFVTTLNTQSVVSSKWWMGFFIFAAKSGDWSQQNERTPVLWQP